MQADLGEVEALRTRWYPLPPSEDWIVIVDDAAGSRRGILLTQLFTPLTERLFMILEEEASAECTTWIALPADAEITPSRRAFLQGMDARLIPCSAPDWLPGLPCRPDAWAAQG